MALRDQKFQEVFTDFKNKNCTGKGNQRSNMSKAEQEGIKSLQERVNKHEVLVLQTDKSGKFALASPDMYLEMGKRHVTNDKQISWPEVREIQSRVSGHCSMWLKML